MELNPYPVRFLYVQQDDGIGQVARVGQKLTRSSEIKPLSEFSKCPNQQNSISFP